MAKGLSLEDFGKMHGFDRKEEFSAQKNFPQKKSSPQKNSQQKNFQQKNFQQKTFWQKSFGGNNQYGRNVAEDSLATAPYNFVALPEKILPSPIEDIETYKKQIQSAELFSGEIEIEIESLTPLFIGGNGEKNFAPVKEIIPGSSLRGMLKNIFKIVTCSTFRGGTETQKKGEDFNDEHIYYRCLMKNNQVTWNNGYNWSKDLNAAYNERMTSFRQGKLVKNARPGFLIQKTNGNFFIAPSIYRSDRKDDKILIKKYEEDFNDRVAIRNDSRITWHGREAYIITGSQSPERLHDEKSYARLDDEQKKKAGKQFIRFTKIDYVDWSRDHWLALPDEVRKSYEHDRNRKSVNLFKDKGILKREQIESLTNKKLPDIKTLVPCHFLEEGGRVTAFGHGQCFRIPYKNSVGNVVGKNLQSAEIIDFADAVFGRSDFWASRVFFEDAIIPNAETLPTALVKPLMQPNPTSFQLYLQQNDKNSLSHWDSGGAKIRGYKMYWHNSFADWQTDKVQNENLIKKITPLKAGNKFKSKIRFENLTKIEIGALLMIFDLNGAKNPAYKIGMGKPLGLGSIKISPKLFVESETAYTEIFDGDIFKSPYREEKFADYLDAFKNYIENCGLKSSWEKVMSELNLILDWDNTQKNNWQEKIKSMSGDVQSGNVDKRFIKRMPLQTIFEVVKC